MRKALIAVIIGIAAYVCYWLYIARACPTWWFNILY